MDRVAPGGSVRTRFFAVAVIVAATLGLSLTPLSLATLASTPGAGVLGEFAPEVLSAPADGGSGSPSETTGSVGQPTPLAALSALHHSPIRCGDTTVQDLSFSDSVRLSRLTRSLDDGSLGLHVTRLSWQASAMSTLAAAGLPLPTLSRLHVRLQI